MPRSDEAIREREELPTFELECWFDDPERPREVTVFDPLSEDRTSTWISADVSHTVPLDRVA